MLQHIDLIELMKEIVLIAIPYGKVFIEFADEVLEIGIFRSCTF
jgi:hypothetical protein